MWLPCWDRRSGHPYQTGWLTSAHHMSWLKLIVQMQSFVSIFIYLLSYLLSLSLTRFFAAAIEQLEEYSLRSHLIQTKQPLKKNKQPVLGTKTFPWPWPAAMLTICQYCHGSEMKIQNLLLPVNVNCFFLHFAFPLQKMELLSFM